MNIHLFWDLGERTFWHFKAMFGASRIAKTAYPFWPTNNRHSNAGLNEAALVSYPFKV